MAEVLLLNPSPRKKAKKARRRNPGKPSAAQLRARKAFAEMARSRSAAARKANPKRRKARRRNPTPALARVRRQRSKNPIARSYRRAGRRRSNPISLAGIMPMLRESAVMGAGAVVADLAYGYAARWLPANLQAGPGQLTAGSAVKAFLTAWAGHSLRGVTRGMSVKAAQGAIVVQARDIVANMLPPMLGAQANVGRVGWASPAVVQPMQTRIGGAGRVGAYTPGVSPSLSAYTPGVSPSLSSFRSARMREGVSVR